MCMQSWVWLKLQAKSSSSQARCKWNTMSFFTVIPRCSGKIHGYLEKSDDDDYYFITNLSWRFRMCVSTQTKKLRREEWKISNQVREEVWVRPQKMQRCAFCHKAPWGGSSGAMLKSELTAQPAQAGPCCCCRKGDFWCLPCIHPLPCLLAPDFMVGWLNSLTRGKEITWVLFCSLIVSVYSLWHQMTVKSSLSGRVAGAEGQHLLLSSVARC